VRGPPGGAAPADVNNGRWAAAACTAPRSRPAPAAPGFGEGQGGLTISEKESGNAGKGGDARQHLGDNRRAVAAALPAPHPRRPPRPASLCLPLSASKCMQHAAEWDAAPMGAALALRPRSRGGAVACSAAEWLACSDRTRVHGGEEYCALRSSS
jgi:hypothetical protein